MGYGGLHKGIELHRMHTPKHLAYQVDAALFIKLCGRGMAENMRVEIPGKGMSFTKQGFLMFILSL
jgi:hypothetical protein